jgi:hypothetical protein
MWARVLAGEIRKPGAFSLVTLQFVSILDANTAAIINKVAPWVINGEIVPTRNSPITVSELVFLEEVGFGSGAAGTLSVTLAPEAHGNTVIRAGRRGLVIDNDKKPFDVHCFALSLAGRQLVRVIDTVPNVKGIVSAVRAAAPSVKTIFVGEVEPTSPVSFHVRDAKQVYPEI